MMLMIMMLMMMISCDEGDSNQLYYSDTDDDDDDDQVDHLTVGGLVLGGGLESTSHKHGMFHQVNLITYYDD